MKILIQESGKRQRKIVFPTRLIFNPLTASVAIPIINKTLAGELSEADVEITAAEEISNLPYNEKIKRADLIRLFREVNRIKKINRGLPLFDVEDENGDKVKIYL